MPTEEDWAEIRGLLEQEKMKRDDVIRLIRDRMSEVEIVDDEDDGAE